MINFYEYHKVKLDDYDLYAKSFIEFDNYIADLTLVTPSEYPVDDLDFTPILHIIRRCPVFAYLYARGFKKGRWLECEPYMLKSAATALDYARWVMGSRWLEAEPYIMEDPFCACMYAKYVIRDRWLEAEEIIKTDEVMWNAYVSALSIC